MLRSLCLGCALCLLLAGQVMATPSKMNMVARVASRSAPLISEA